MKSKVNNVIFIVIIGMLLGLTMSVSYCSTFNPDFLVLNIKVDDQTNNLMISAPSENGIPICDKVRTQREPKIAIDGSGGAFISWSDHRNNEYYSDLYSQRIDSDGNFHWLQRGIPVDFGAAAYVNIINDDMGGAILIWEDYHQSNSGIFGMRIGSNGGRLWPGLRVAVCTAVNGGTNYGTQIINDETGGVIATWVDERVEYTLYIYAQRVNATGNVVWNPTGVPICTAANYQYSPTICNDGEGGAIITWEDTRGIGSDNDIYIQHINSTGGGNWTVNGEPVCTDPYQQNNPKICSDNNNGAIVAWIDGRNSYNADIYAQRIDKNGQAQWTTNGIEVALTDGDIYDFKICSDGAGGAIIVWNDLTSNNYGIYAQRIDSNGATLWNTDGEPICTVNTSIQNLQICSDGGGGAIIAWEDGRSEEYYSDIYAQRIDSSGNVQWTKNGIPIVKALYDQKYSDIVSDGEGGAIITWEDWRSGNDADIYAQRVNSDGELQWLRENEAPISNHPEDMSFPDYHHDTINWTIYDDSESGTFRVLINKSADDFFVWMDWYTWFNDTLIQVPINNTYTGIYDYTIEYYDNEFVSGVSDTVRVDFETRDGGRRIPFKIAFGNYHLLFSFLGIIAIVILTKHRISSKPK